MTFPLAAQSSTSAPETATPVAAEKKPIPIVSSPRPINPILKMTIAPEKRGDLSTCDDRDPPSLEFVAKTCWPVLQAYQDLIRLQQASKAAISAQKRTAPNAEDLRNRALMLAIKAAKQHGGGRWPMQDEIAQGAYRSLIALHKQFGHHDAALTAYDGLIAVQARSLMHGGTARRGYIYKDKSKYLLELGRRDDALANFKAAVALADSQPIDLISNVEHAELIAYDATIAKDEDRALDVINLFLKKTERHSRHQDLVYYPVRILRIYILAGREDHNGVLAELKTFNSLARRNMCQQEKPVEFYFPQVVSPTQSDPRIAAELKTFGCSDAVIAAMDTNMANGVPASDGIKPLPPR
ncbi:hypothetical protein [Sphingorhabdus sp. EL138]|uniref:hypothetical protein n=1 Tax=Sphingorhabdus sp. EL138 TaxID=2073156 RepID=UPI0013A59EA3|nr:hypothetical protein [Sphingorhabdus sp. EL138]